jgi:hypothetical protein
VFKVYNLQVFPIRPPLGYFQRFNLLSPATTLNSLQKYLGLLQLHKFMLHSSWSKLHVELKLLGRGVWLDGYPQLQKTE